MGSKPDQADDFDLFRQEIGDVRPLRDAPRTDSRAPRSRPRPEQSRLDERAVLDELLEGPVLDPELENGEELLFLRDGFQKKFLKRLRRGHYSITDSLDLHQMNEATANQAIRDFLEHCVRRGLGCVRIVHGKGLRSRNGPKLKRLTARLLSRHPNVVAFASCRPQDGGTGAVTVLLRHRNLSAR